METPIVPEATGAAAPAKPEGEVKPEGAANVGAEGGEGSQSANKGSGTANAAAAAAVRKYKLKYGDVEEEVEESELVRRAQKVTGIEKKAELAAKQHKVATEFLRLMKEDPSTFAKRAKEIGMDPEAFAVEIINSKLKYEQMTPEQRELEALRQDKAVREKADKAREEADHKAKLDKETQDYRESLEKEIMEAFTTVKLPKTPWTTARIAAYIDAGLQNGKQYKIVDVAKIVQKEFHNYVNEVLGGFPEDQILDFLKPEIQETISRARVKRLSPPAPVSPAAPKAPKQSEEPKLDPRKHKLSRQWLRRDDHPDAE